MRGYTRIVASLGVAVFIALGSLIGPASSAGASVTSNATTYYGDVGTTQCGNCSLLVDVSTWSTALAYPRPYAIVQKDNCTVPPDWYEIFTNHFASGGLWYAEFGVTVRNSSVSCGGTIDWRMSVVNGS